MINNSVLEPTRRLASEFDARDLKICPIHGSPLAKLVEAMNSMNPGNTDVMSEVVKGVEPLNHGVDKYQFNKDQIVDHVGKLCSNILNFAKNEINPIVKEILVGVEKIKEEQDQIAVNAGARIVPVSLDPVVVSPIMEHELTSVVGDGDFVPLDITLYEDLWINTEVNEIIKMLMTSNEAFNASLMSLIETNFPDGTIKSASFQSRNNLAKNIEERFSKNCDVIAFLFLKAVKQNKHPRVDFGELTKDQQGSISMLTNFWGRAVINRTRSASSLAGSGRVVLGINVEECIIKVHLANYTKWLESGGTTDALIGYWYHTGKGSNLSNLDRINMDKERFEETFRRQRNQAVAASRVALDSKVERYITDRVHNVIDERITETQERDQMKAKANKIRSGMSISSFGSYDKYCRLVVCKTIGKDSDALEVLNGIDNYLEEHADAEMDEAIFHVYSMLVVKAVFGSVLVVNADANVGGMVSV